MGVGTPLSHTLLKLLGNLFSVANANIPTFRLRMLRPLTSPAPNTNPTAQIAEIFSGQGGVPPPRYREGLGIGDCRYAAPAVAVICVDRSRNLPRGEWPGKGKN